MADEGLDLLERNPEGEEKKKPIVEDAEALLKLRSTVRKIDYPEWAEVLDKLGNRIGDAEARRITQTLPKTEQELRDGLDLKLKQIVDRQEVKIEFEKKVPQIALRKLDEEQWEKIGWNEESRTAVIKLLQKRLELTGEHGSDNYKRAENAMHMIVASGKKADEALRILGDENLLESILQRVDESQRKQQQYDPHHAQRTAKLYYLRDELGVAIGKDENYIQRFVLDDDFRKELDYEYDSALPQNLYDLAWNMGYHKQEQFGMNGRTPILQMQVQWVDVKDENGEVVKDPQTGKAKQKLEGRYVVNQANLMHWLRGQMWEWYEVFDTQDVTDYFTKVQIHKGQFATVNLITMLFDVDRYWRDEMGYKWDGLYNQVLLEPWMLYFLRTYAVEYDKVSHDEEKLKEAYQNLFHLSKLTMKIYGKSMVQILTTLPEDYEGKDSDTKVGEAWLKMYLAYYSLADFDELKRVLGEDSSFFTKEGWIEAAQKVYEKSGGDWRTHMPEMDKFFGMKQKEFSKAFDPETGKVTEETKGAFLKFINIYTSEFPSTNIHLTLDRVLKDTVADLTLSKEANLEHPDYKGAITHDGKVKDSTSLDYAWLIAHAWTHFTGALARGNFPEVSGHFAETKWLYTDAYREKYMGFAGAGNWRTIPMFKQLSLPLLEGILLENSFEPYVYSYNEKGQPVDKDGNVGLSYRQRTPMEVFKKMNDRNNYYEAERSKLRKELGQTTDSAERAKIMGKLDKLEDDSKNESKMRASQLEFNENAMRVYSKNLIGRAAAIYDQLMKGEETEFDKFTTYDGLFRGPSFKRSEWQAALQSKYVTPLRYLFEANGATQLNMKSRFPFMDRRDPDGKPHYVWKTMYVGERMLGYEMLNIPTFRKQVQDVDPQDWQLMRAQGYKQKGKYVMRPDGKYDINYDRVQDNKKMIYKQFLLMKIGADLWQHIDRHSTDPGYSLEHYENIIKAVEELPGNLDADEFDIKRARITTPFFSHEQIQWLRKISGANKHARAEFIKAIFMGDPHKKESAISESASIILSAIFRGY